MEDSPEWGREDCALADLADLVGIPFVEKGRDRSGADCYGVFKMAQERFGNNVPDVDVSAFAPLRIDELMREQLPLWEKLIDPAPGDAVALAMEPEMPDLVQHYGVYVGEGKFIHTLSKTGSMIVPLAHPFWEKRLRGFYRWKK